MGSRVLEWSVYRAAILGWLSCVWALVLVACDVTEDGTSGAEQCSQAAAVQACPAGSVPRLDAASTAQCGGTVEGSYSQIRGVDGSVTGACAAAGECAFACVFETPCRCGIQTLSRDAIVCTTPCAACGNSICEDGESVDSCPGDCTAACGNGECERGETAELCSLDCGGTCVPGEQRCNATDRQVCNPRGQFETLACGGENRCRETEGGATECVAVASAVCESVSRCCDGAFARNVGEACDDGQFCTSASSCTGDGTCEAPVERDCANELSLTACQTAVCDEVRDRCEAQAANEGGACDNPETATVDRCLAGACVASECECSGVNDCCDGCFVRNVGGTCDDGIYCTAGDTCSSNGQCVAGPARSCAGTPVGNCQIAVCDDEVDACRSVSSPDLAGSACDDGAYCTVGETCTATGSCGGGRARDCSGVITVAQCQSNAACDEAAGQCTFVAVNAGSTCSSPNFCVVNATCTAAGGCEGSTRDCSSARTEPACQGTPVCNAAAGRCEAPAANNGGACDDGLLCTSNDRCSGGVCAGSEVACGTATACRAAGICDESTGTCSGSAQPDGTSCPVTNGFGVCAAGNCGITTCRGGFANCDGNATNGCEVPVDADPNNCGGCGITCTGSQFTGVCTSGFCELRAGTSWEYCESTPGRGDRPVNLADDDNNCGACGVQCGALSECGARTCSPVPLEFVRISAGTFQMGSPLGELGRSSYAETIHPVTLTRDFLLSRTEVTQGHWQDLLNTNPSFAENPNVPMRNLTWWEAVEFANVLSLAQGLPPCYTLSGCSGALGSGSFNCEDVTVNAAGSNPLLCTGYRLPTEAEWEYSYRAGTSTAFYSGEITYDRSEPVDENLDAIGWYRGNSTSLNSGRVGLKAPNAWGLFDMAGNTSEWCWDWFNTYPGTVVDPLGLESGGTWRVYRGGGLYNDAAFARAAYRYDGTASSNGCCDIGIRLARTAP